MTHSSALSTRDRQLGLVVLKNLAREEIKTNERLLTSLTERMSGEGLEVAAEAINGRLGQLQKAIQLAEELLAEGDQLLLAEGAEDVP